MALRYCFENPIKTLQKSKPHDLAVVDTFVRKFISLQYNEKSNYHTQAPRMHSKMVE